jgi:hypothetical protein
VIVGNHTLSDNGEFRPQTGFGHESEQAADTMFVASDAGCV